MSNIHFLDVDLLSAAISSLQGLNQDDQEEVLNFKVVEQ